MTHPVTVWHLNDNKVWVKMTMEAIDANHAVEVDPEHWSLTEPAIVVERVEVEEHAVGE